MKADEWEKVTIDVIPYYIQQWLYNSDYILLNSIFDDELDLSFIIIINDNNHSN